MSRPDDHAARRIVLEELERDLLVEAGAGSGKTTALVGRILNLLITGTARIEEIAAVTFTRKAAGELRQRVQQAMEEALRGRPPVGMESIPDDGEVRERLRAGLAGLDRAFMGTIHAFCARLLRERPLEARLDPGFSELTAPEEKLLARRFWDEHLESLVARGAPEIEDLEAVGLRASRLHSLFRKVSEATDVHFPLDEIPPPDPAEVEELRAKLEAIMDDALPLTAVLSPNHSDRDSMGQKIVAADYRRRVSGFDRTEVFFQVVQSFCAGKSQNRTFNRWHSVDGPVDKEEVRAIEERLNALFAETDAGEAVRPGRRLLAEWRAHRYGPAIRLVREAARAFATYRRRNGMLTFHDLLVLTVDMLERAPNARRSLGERYRRLLVDEFQDTDPLQTRLVFLLSSEPTAQDTPERGTADGFPEEAAGASQAGGVSDTSPIPWTGLVPRPGALFVVGDPKQSIYRFRRADIALYERVRARFADFGQVVRLTANFRSGPAIEELVDGVFGPEHGLFPTESSEVQAGFAPLRTRPPAPGVVDRVAAYVVPWERRRSSVWEKDAGMLATWIADRVESGERRPEDFMILTRQKAGLQVYARELEARNLPVSVAGSGIGVEGELSELLIVLRALSDPGDPVPTLAALEGLFFGLSPQDLLDHRRAGGRFDLRSPGTESDGAVARALRRLHGWWQLAREEPADRVVAEIVASAGLLPWAASGDLGSLRAGALAFALDLLRSATVSADASLDGALDALNTVLEDDETEVESPLEPASGGAVRLMNLHKAKGLEAKVVILADPSGDPPRGTDFVVRREPDGSSTGFIYVDESSSRSWRRTPLAEPPGWRELSAREDEFGRAEEDRLLYVAVTRAEEELVVATAGEKPKGPWQKLDRWLARNAETLELERRSPPERPVVTESLDQLQAREAAMRVDRDAAARAAWRVETVTRLVHGEDGDPAAPHPAPGPSGEGVEAHPPSTPAAGWRHSVADSGGVGGTGWGTAVHATLEAALRGLPKAAVRMTARTALLENDRPVVDGEPAELDTLIALVDALRETELWARAEASELRLVEHPFVHDRGDGIFVEGVIDLAFRTDDGWVLVDWKTASSDFAFEERRPGYEAQIAIYAEAWTALTGEPVVETHVHRVHPPAGAVG